MPCENISSGLTLVMI